MYVTEKLRQDWQKRYGIPRVLPIRQAISAQECTMIKQSQHHGRAHDITLFILDQEKVVLIKKHFFPPGAYRAPSGGLMPGESLEDGAAREGLEETGLRIVLKTYLLRALAEFYTDSETLHWTSDVFSAGVLGGTLETQDPEEIAEVRWGTIEELQGSIREALLRSGRSLFHYRVQLTDAAVEALKT
jgi:8-oxo-dGTP pyrophosphatase MutT (NUDIX family)